MKALPWSIDESGVTIRVRWWAESLRPEQVKTRAAVILALYKAARDVGIDMPFPTRTILLHDQTEEVDGDRTWQREGWPAGANPPRPLRATKGERDGADT
ncbi:hypothetical protein [Sphingomonas sp.]|uniref:hypothetical protein n=1 Tax=Sphingomonas sp. TaxID=28214 RepID=UPI003AFFDB61